VIALLGDSGLARGPHLHFELRAGGQVYDPESLFERNGPRSVASAGPAW
jgi:murein DD-endopeptidase MepM/ murein hydrolase activator NlpD